MTDLSNCEPCPFCGNDHEEELTILIGQRWYPWSCEYHDNYNVACSCGAQGPDSDTQEEAIERWNQRKETR